LEPTSAPPKPKPADKPKPKPGDKGVEQENGKLQTGKGKLGTLTNPETYENVPGHAGAVADPAVENHGPIPGDLVTAIQQFFKSDPLRVRKAGRFMLMCCTDVDQAGTAGDQFRHLG